MAATTGADIGALGADADGFGAALTPCARDGLRDAVAPTPPTP